VQIGIVKVMKSGKVRMQMGCCEYVVTPGVGEQCRSEVHVINLRTKDIVMVGENSRHAVAALDIDSFLNEIEASKAGA
jgi:RNA polymerase III RPC4